MISSLFVCVHAHCNFAAWLLAGNFEGVEFRRDAVVACGAFLGELGAGLGRRFLPLFCGEVGILRFTAASAERDCVLIFH
jgi:hypothetical protein